MDGAGREAMRRGGAGKRRDGPESDIIKALRKHGWGVLQLHERGGPDLLLWHPSNWYDTSRVRYLVCEVKTATGTRTPAQADTPWPIVRSVEDALRLIR